MLIMAKINRQERAENLRAFDDKFRGLGLLAGMDEVGRGPLAGDVVTACVVLPREPLILWVDDSKKLSEKKRETKVAVVQAASVFLDLEESIQKSVDFIHMAGKEGAKIIAFPESLRVSFKALSGKPP